ncbi:MAG: MBL fold metallo-hydrolase [Candidatus Bathyarchaeota archaeon]|nr:MAG: MBL fold metallo-hydrolase [Candidatus Bathyarchaeota archaeon]
MVVLTFYGGVDEIGGNKILLQDGDTKVFFDFGQSFNMGSNFFTSWLSARRVNGLGDYFEFGLLPKLKGVYTKELLEFTDLPYVDPEVDAVFLSHAHFDHIEHIKFLDPEIPIYVGEGTKLFMNAAEKTSTFCNYRKHPYRTFRTGDKININSISVQPIHVDHSIPAAYGFLIETSEGVISYSGDLRVHGTRKDLTTDFVSKACACELEAIVCEGTRMVETEKRKNYSEEQVAQLSSDVVSSTDNIVFATHYSRDMDRLRTFYQIAKNNSRQLVISPKTAYLLSTLLGDKRLDLPDPLNDDTILVYYKRKKSGQFEEKDYYVWEREFMDKMVTHDFVHNNQSKLVMDLDFYQFAELIDIKPDAGSHFIHSMSEPFSEEDVEDEVMHNWLDHFKMKFHQYHASGHLHQDHITSLIDQIKPKKIFPIHTENQQLFKKLQYTIQIIKPGETYSLR